MAQDKKDLDVSEYDSNKKINFLLSTSLVMSAALVAGSIILSELEIVIIPSTAVFYIGIGLAAILSSSLLISVALDKFYDNKRKQLEAKISCKGSNMPKELQQLYYTKLLSSSNRALIEIILNNKKVFKQAIEENKLVFEKANLKFKDAIKEPNYLFEYVVSIGNKKAAEIIIERGEVNLKSQDVDRIMLSAIFEGNLPIVRLLLKIGFDIRSEKESNHPGFLSVAVIGGSLEVVKELVASGANINKKIDKGNTPLMIAVQEKHEDIVEFLIKLGADVNIKNDIGEKVFDIANKLQEDSKIKSLIKAKEGVEPNTKFLNKVKKAICFNR